MHTTNSYDQEQSRSNCISLTLPHLIDKIAEHTPNRVFISLPITHNPADGYRDYTYQDFARAIDRCAWWISATIKENADFETLAYIGTQDFRCMILIVAVIKTGHKFQGFYPALTEDSYLHLIRASHCRVLLCSAPILPAAQRILDLVELSYYLVPELPVWLNSSPVLHFAYKRPVPASTDPMAIVHTSGTTGPPKPVPLTHGWWASQYASFSHVQNHNLTCSHFCGLRVLVVIPFSIAAGIACVLILNIVHDFIVVLPPPWIFTITPRFFDSCLLNLEVQAAIIPPRFCRPIARTPQYLNHVSRLKYLVYAGAPCPPDAGTVLASRTHLTQIYGNTESGGIPTLLMAPENCAYMSFHPNFPCAFRHVGRDLYALVVTRNDTDAGTAFKSAFHSYPGSGDYKLHDLFSPHPSREATWCYRGRTEDLTWTASGEIFVPGQMEVMIEAHPLVKGAVIHGQRTAGLGLVVELTVGCMSDKASKERIMDEIWEIVKQANEICPVRGKVERNLIIRTENTNGRGMPRGVKGYPVRSQVIKKFTGRSSDFTNHKSSVVASHL